MRLESQRFGCFGKLPVSPEFLVEGASELARSGFDGWVAEGLGLARHSLGSERFREVALGFPPLRFVWSMPEGTRAAAGVLVPSEDGAGRVHPFALYAWIERGESAPDDPVHPLYVRPLHDYLDTLLGACRAARDPGEVLRCVRSAALDCERSAGLEYTAFVQTRSLDALFRDLEESLVVPGLVGRLREQLVQALFETVSYLRGRAPIDIRLGVRGPLLPGPTVTPQIAVWIDLVRRIFGSAVPGPCSFWTHPGAQGTSPMTSDAGTSPPSLPDAVAPSPASPPPPTSPPSPASAAGAFHFFFSRPTSAQWISLVDPAASVETISALEQPYGGDPGDRMAPALRAVLRSPSATLADLLQAVRS